MRRRYSYWSLFRRAFLFLFFLGIIGWVLVEDAQALRPFTSATDAGILDPGYLELEAGIGLGRNTRHALVNRAGVYPLRCSISAF